MDEKEIQRRIVAVKTADAIHAIKGTPISDYARELSIRWVRGEMTDEQMNDALSEFHKKLVEQSHGKLQAGFTE